jgi:hypothetical protein
VRVVKPVFPMLKLLHITVDVTFIVPEPDTSWNITKIKLKN